jgi:hypothetical protein
MEIRMIPPLSDGAWAALGFDAGIRRRKYNAAIGFGSVTSRKVRDCLERRAVKTALRASPMVVVGIAGALRSLAMLRASRDRGQPMRRDDHYSKWQWWLQSRGETTVVTRSACSVVVQPSRRAIISAALQPSPRRPQGIRGMASLAASAARKRIPWQATRH